MNESPSIDLNLIRVFVAIYETGSASLAAHRLGLTQPSVSHALSRLRIQYNDHLFARHSSGLKPTHLSEQLFPRLQEALSTIESTVDETRAFNPLTTNRQVRIAMSDIGALYFVPPLLQHLSNLSPNLKVEINQPTSDLAEQLSSGAMDLAVGNLPELLPHTRVRTLFNERYVCLLAREHPSISDNLSLASFSKARHVMVTSPWSGHALIDGALSSHGFVRNIVAKVPHFTSLPTILAKSDLLAILPSRVARLFMEQGALKMLELPVTVPSFEVRIHWHNRQQSSPVNMWLRDRLGVQAEH